MVCPLQETGGEYGVALNERHFEDLVFSHASPPPSVDREKHASLVSLYSPACCLCCPHALLGRDKLKMSQATASMDVHV